MENNENKTPPKEGALERTITINGMLAPTLLGINVVGIILCIAIMLTLSANLNERSGAHLLELVKADYHLFEDLDVDTRASMASIKGLESKLGGELSERGVLNAAQVMLETEHNAQIFLRLLKVNMYNLTGFITGTASWYEHYVPEIDDAIQRSRSRQLKLLKIQEHYANEA